jgi:hypothetical protein
VDQAIGSAVERIGTVPEPRLPAYVPDRRSRRARWRRRIWWVAFVVGAFFYGLLFTFLPPAFIPPLSIPLLILAALVIWALPAKARAAPVRTMRWLFMGFTVAMIAWPNYLAIALPGLPWITLTRIFSFPLVLIFLASLSLSLTTRRDLKEVLDENRIGVRLLLLFIAIQVVSILFSNQPFDSFQRFIIDQIYWTAMFFLGCYLFRDPKLIVRWAWTLIGLAVFVSILGVWEWRLGRLPWVGHIPSFLQIADESVARTLAGTSRSGAIAHRVEGTFAVALGLSEFLALVSPLIIHFAVEGSRPLVRLLALSTLPLILFTIYNTGSRIGSVGFCVALLLYGGLWALRRWSLDRNSVVGPAMTLGYPLLASAFLALTFISGRLRQIVWGGANTEGSNQARIDQFNMGWPMVLKAPLGHGVGQGAIALGYVNGDAVLTIDTYTLRLALEYGLLGLVVYYAFFLLALVPSIRVALRTQDRHEKMLIPLSVSILVFLVGKTVFSSEYSHPIVFMMVGAVCAIVAGSRADDAKVPAASEIR